MFKHFRPAVETLLSTVSFDPSHQVSLNSLEKLLQFVKQEDRSERQSDLFD